VKRSTGDLFALAIPLGEAIGRIGCFIGGCCYGKIANGLSWAVYDHDAWRHPTQLYLSFGAACCFAILLFAERKKLLPENSLFAMGGMLFCIDRFIVEFFREGATMVGSITLAQIGCCVGFAVFAFMFARKAAAWNHRNSILANP
jgi:phosphatidylglycerol:prolipoprotein diacylglycerol transferase